MRLSIFRNRGAHGDCSSKGENPPALAVGSVKAENVIHALQSCSSENVGCENCPYRSIVNCNTRKNMDAAAYLAEYVKKFGEIEVKK